MLFEPFIYPKSLNKVVKPVFQSRFIPKQWILHPKNPSSKVLEQGWWIHLHTKVLEPFIPKTLFEPFIPMTLNPLSQVFSTKVLNPCASNSLWALLGTFIPNLFSNVCTLCHAKQRHWKTLSPSSQVFQQSCWSRLHAKVPSPSKTWSPSSPKPFIPFMERLRALHPQNFQPQSVNKVFEPLFWPTPSPSTTAR